MATVYDRYQCSCVNQTVIYPKGGARLQSGLFVRGVSLVDEAASVDNGEAQEGDVFGSNVQVVEDEGIDGSV